MMEKLIKKGWTSTEAHSTVATFEMGWKKQGYNHNPTKEILVFSGVDVPYVEKEDGTVLNNIVNYDKYIEKDGYEVKFGSHFEGFEDHYPEDKYTFLIEYHEYYSHRRKHDMRPETILCEDLDDVKEKIDDLIRENL